MFGAQQGIASAGFETNMARAENIGSGFNLGSVLVGGAASALTGGIAGGIGASMFKGGNFLKGMSASLMGGGSEYFSSLAGIDQ